MPCIGCEGNKPSTQPLLLACDDGMLLAEVPGIGKSYAAIGIYRIFGPPDKLALLEGVYGGRGVPWGYFRPQEGSNPMADSKNEFLRPICLFVN